VPEPSALEVEKPKRHKLPGTDQIPAEIIKSGVEKFVLRFIHLLILFGIRRNCLWSGRSRSLYLFIRKGIQQIVVIIEAYPCVKHVQYCIQHPTVKTNTKCRRFYWVLSMLMSTQQVTNDHLFCIRQILEKIREYNEAVNQLFVDFKKAYDSVSREVLYNILIGFGIPIKIVRLLLMCLNETYSTVRVGKHLSDMFLIRNGLKQCDIKS
jgi:hypothetical protein